MSRDLVSIISLPLQNMDVLHVCVLFFWNYLVSAAEVELRQSNGDFAHISAEDNNNANYSSSTNNEDIPEAHPWEAAVVPQSLPIWDQTSVFVQQQQQQQLPQSQAFPAMYTPSHKRDSEQISGGMSFIDIDNGSYSYGVASLSYSEKAAKFVGNSDVHQSKHRPVNCFVCSACFFRIAEAVQTH